MFIYGKNTVKDLFINKPESIKRVFIDKKRHQSFYNELHKNQIRLEDFKKFNINKHFKGTENIQGIVAQINEPEFLSLSSLINKYKEKTRPIFLILDQVNDPQNFGAIIRNAVAFDVDAIIFSANHSSPLTSTAMKASSGSWINIDLCKVNSLNSTISQLKKSKYWIIATSLKANENLDNIANLNQPLSIILGNEGSGVRKTLLDKSDFKVKINISKNIDSLNVASTSAIILHSIQKK